MWCRLHFEDSWILKVWQHILEFNLFSQRFIYIVLYLINFMFFQQNWAGAGVLFWGSGVSLHGQSAGAGVVNIPSPDSLLVSEAVGLLVTMSKRAALFRLGLCWSQTPSSGWWSKGGSVGRQFWMDGLVLQGQAGGGHLPTPTASLQVGGDSGVGT